MTNCSETRDISQLGLAYGIGNTPIQPIHMLIKGKVHTVHLKLEGANPTGSMKDRTGLSLIQDLEKRGLLHADTTVVESTSGNLGVALASLCKAKGHRFIAVIDPKATRENIAKMEALGANIERIYQSDANGGYLLSRLARIRELCAQNQNYVWPNQYSNNANPSIHYLSTGPEIYHQMNKQIGAIFVPVSTGGTLAGIGRYLREVDPTIRIVGVDAYGSVIFGTPPAVRALTGIGSSRRSDFLTEDLYDKAIHVRDEEAFAFCHALYEKTGLKVGGSSGCTLFACAQFLSSHPEMQHVVCVCADRGENYTETIFNYKWIQKLDRMLFKQKIAEALAIIAT